MPPGSCLQECISSSSPSFLVGGGREVKPGKAPMPTNNSSLFVLTQTLLHGVAILSIIVEGTWDLKLRH